MSLSRQNRAKVLSFLEKASTEVTLTDLSDSLELPKRSVQIWVAALVEEKRIVREGQGPNTRYRIGNRLPITYQFDFLKKYKPNRSFFLSLTERKMLRKLGLGAGVSTSFETYAAHIYERLIIDLSWSSSKLEGNTYSLLETEKLIQDQTLPQGKSRIETQMILNHKEAIQFLIQNRREISLNGFTVKNLHALLSQGLLKNASSEGNIRQIPVGIEGSRYIPLNIPQKLNEEFEAFLKKGLLIRDPFEQALFVLIFLPYLQPFEDLNKRTSRVGCNIAFLKSSLIPVSFINIDTQEYIDAIKEVYELNQTVKMKALFIKAYQFSAERYRFIKAELQEPDPVGVQFREIIKAAVKQCVIQKCKPTLALISKKVPKNHQSRVMEIVVQELKSLHEGNIARFGLTLSEYRRADLKFR